MQTKGGTAHVAAQDKLANHQAIEPADWLLWLRRRCFLCRLCLLAMSPILSLPVLVLEPDRALASSTNQCWAQSQTGSFRCSPLVEDACAIWSTERSSSSAK